LIALSEELSLMLRSTNVHVSALCPGFTHTDFHAVAGLDEMKSRLPSFLWYDAGTVVREGLDAVEKNKPIMVSGRIYRWLDPLAHSALTRPLITALAPARRGTLRRSGRPGAPIDPHAPITSDSDAPTDPEPSNLPAGTQPCRSRPSIPSRPSTPRTRDRISPS